MLTERSLEVRFSGFGKVVTVLCRKRCSSTGGIMTVAPAMEQEDPDRSQFDIDMFVGQSECEAQSGPAQRSSTVDMLCGCCCDVKPDSISIRVVSWAETELGGHINDTATRVKSADCVIRLITLNL